MKFLIETFLNGEWEPYTWNETLEGARDIAEYLHTNGRIIRIVHEGKIVFQKGDV